MISISGKNVKIIAEVKTKSPFNFEAGDSWDELFEIANKIGDIISIHTDSRWDGGFDLISKARKLTKKPILAKGIHESDDDIKRAIECGADYVLVVGRIPESHRHMCMIEPVSLEQLAEIPFGLNVVWNSRDLDTGNQKTETFEQARNLWAGWLCQASHIRTVKDIKEGADAVLVGEHLKEFAHSLQ